MTLVNGHNTTGLPDLFRMYCVAGQTARLTVNYPDGDCIFFFEKGDLIEAQLGYLKGTEAVQQALRQQEEGFRVDLDVAVPPRTIFGAIQGLLAEETELSRAGQSFEFDGLTTEPEARAAASEPNSDQKPDHEQRQSGSGNEENAQPENIPPITINRPVTSALTAPPVAEDEMAVSENQIMRPTVVPTLAEYEEKAGEQSPFEHLVSTGIVQSGIIIDEDGVNWGSVKARCSTNKVQPCW
jgi:Domain of unknown function (DUF4388)